MHLVINTLCIPEWQKLLHLDWNVVEFLPLECAHHMFLDWMKSIRNNERITLHTAKWICIIVLWQKSIKSISALIKEGQLQSPGMEYYYLSLYVLNWAASLLLVIPQYPRVFVVQVAQQVVGTHFSSYILSD